MQTKKKENFDDFFQDFDALPMKTKLGGAEPKVQSSFKSSTQATTIAASSMMTYVPSLLEQLIEMNSGLPSFVCNASY